MTLISKPLPDPADDNKFKVSLVDPTKPVRFTQKNIDNFRNFATGYSGPLAEIFTATKTIPNWVGKNVQVYANRLPEECLGYQPGDIYKNVLSGKFHYVNGCWRFSGGKSKMYCDILSAQTAEEAMDLAFFGKDYDEPQSDFDAANRKGHPKRVGTREIKKYANLNLKFNEVKIWTRLEHLDHYAMALRSKWVQWLNPGDATGVGATEAEKCFDASGNLTETGKKIDQNYNLAKKFIEDYEKLDGINWANLDKTELESWKTNLENYKSTRFYTGGVWKPVIEDFILKVENASTNLPKEDPEWVKELNRLKMHRSLGLAHRIYQNCQPDQDGFNQAVFEELKMRMRIAKIV